jgi:hypothetical protein
VGFEHELAKMANQAKKNTYMGWEGITLGGSLNGI